MNRAWTDATIARLGRLMEAEGAMARALPELTASQVDDKAATLDVLTCLLNVLTAARGLPGDDPVLVRVKMGAMVEMTFRACTAGWQYPGPQPPCKGEAGAG